MSVPLRLQAAVAGYLIKQKLARRERYPLVLMLEPLFKCNLACAGCGKIDYPDDILDQRISVEDALGAADECGAPIVSIAGGEPLLHKELPQIVAGLIERKKYIYLCTNALLLSKRIDDYQPSPYLSFSIHLDGMKDRHDTSVCQTGVFERAVEAVKLALGKGFRVSVNCTLFQGESPEEVAEFLDFCTELGVESITLASGFSYEHAPRQDIFIPTTDGKQLFRSVFAIAKRLKKRWPLNHSPLYMDFLAGNQTFHCTPWGNPTRNVFGWQKPCYLLVDEGYAPTFKSLMEDTPWEKYGTSNNPKCANCTAHCGYEPTAVNEAFRRPWKALSVGLFGPRTSGALAPAVARNYSLPEPKRPVIRVESVS
ncbi:MAG: adenosyl-hopene transferase HpnH [Methylophilales bacterium]|nr:adenosyl-hopene transferase HpnH [Methylophilales bacterium]